MTDDSGKSLSRRQYVGIAGGAGIVALAGCSGGSNSQNTNNGGSGSGNGSSGGNSNAKLEILHGWCGGDGGAAIKALMDGFKKQYPDVSNIDASGVCGGGNTNLNAAVSKRVQNQNYPSTWADWPGKNLTQFTSANILGDIGDSVWSKNDMKSQYRALPKKLAQPAGTYVCVPLQIHRINNLFYNTSVMQKAGVDPTSLSSPKDLIDACKTIQSKTDAAPFAHSTKSPWTTLDVFEVTLLAEQGKSGYDKFTSGKASASDIKPVLERIKSLKDFYPGDAATISWTEANQKVMTGKAAFIVQGDWAAGAYRGNDSFNYESDWNQVPYPGTSDYYDLNEDSFVYPKPNPSPDKTVKFLQYCGTKDGQARFSKHKGSIPARKDVDLSSFPKFQQDQNKDFENTTAIPTITHGLAVSPQKLTELSTAITNFTGSYNVDAAASAMVKAVQ